MVHPVEKVFAPTYAPNSVEGTVQSSAPLHTKQNSFFDKLFKTLGLSSPHKKGRERVYSLGTSSASSVIEDYQERLLKQLSEAKALYEAELSSFTVEQVYAKGRVRLNLLPLYVAQCLVDSSGSIDVSAISQIEKVFLSPVEQRDGVEEWIASGLKQFRNDRKLVQQIESLVICRKGVFSGSIGERIVRASLQKSCDEPLSERDIRVVCVSSCLTWIRQGGEGDCYARSFLTQLQERSFSFFVRDFNDLMLTEHLERTIDGKQSSFYPPETMPPIAGEKKVSREKVSLLENLPPVKVLCSSLGIDKQTLGQFGADAKEDISLGDWISWLKENEIVSEFQQKMAGLYLEAFSQNLFYQYWQNAVVSFLCHPHGKSRHEYPENSWWLAAEEAVSELPKPTREKVLGRLREQIRAYFSGTGMGATLFWLIRYQDANIASTGKLKQIIVSITSGFRGELVPQELASKFITSLYGHVREKGEKVEENPLRLSSTGQAVRGLASRYFSNNDSQCRLIPFQPKEFISWAKHQNTSSAGSRPSSFCCYADKHAFRLLPNLLLQTVSALGGERYIESMRLKSEELFSSLTTVCDSFFPLQDRVGDILISREMHERYRKVRRRSFKGESMCDALKKMKFLSDIGEYTHKEQKRMDEALFETMAIRLPVNQSDTSELIEILTELARKQSKRSRKQRLEKIQILRDKKVDTPLVEVVNQAAGRFEFMAREDREKIRKCMRSVVHNAVIEGSSTLSGLILPFGDANFVSYRGERAFAVLSVFWWNPHEKRWSHIRFDSPCWSIRSTSDVQYISSDVRP